MTKRSWAFVRLLGFGVWVYCEDALLSDWLCGHTAVCEGLVCELSNDCSVLEVAQVFMTGELSESSQLMSHKRSYVNSRILAK